MDIKLVKRYAFYLFRWQLSTFTLAPVLAMLANINVWIATAIANLIGGLIFFWVDKLIFRKKKVNPQWEIVEEAICCDCGISGRSYRVTEYKNYDRTEDKNPQYRCIACSQIKLKSILDDA